MADIINVRANVEPGSAFTLDAVAGLLLDMAILWLLIRFWPKEVKGRRAEEPNESFG